MGFFFFFYNFVEETIDQLIEKIVICIPSCLAFTPWGFILKKRGVKKYKMG